MSNPASAFLGIDFGTSNSAMAMLGSDGMAHPIALEGAATAMPTALFFNFEEHTTHFGRAAMAQYLAGTEGRLMRSLKSLLGSALLQEKTAVHGELVSFQDIIARFLRELAARAEATMGRAPRRVVIGRPVHFVDGDAARDRQAQASLREAAQAAGLGDVTFQMEPIAAAFDYERRVERESLVLIVDIGGGTSDFTVVRLGPKRAVRAERADDILATSGVHIGGTDFDHRLNLELAMPLLGYRHTGPHGREVPSRVFFDLSTWHLIHWLYAPQAVREARALRGDYRDPQLHARLMTVLEERLGHRVAAEVERAKIAGSLSGEDGRIDLGFVAPDLGAPLSQAGMARHLAERLAQVVACAQECLRRAGLPQGALGAIYLTGGSSALRPFQHALRGAFPDTPLVEGDLFGGVAAGLAYAAGRGATR
ncbi:Hsp70 family protein [Ramlibacter sp. H39-3-26]|uniref:Hsp70 family protein n=1 Tax=Curvibacter soli TaxID=3031331 RepID=UPI0023DBC408|nr:Hsp70 family protein [Ramlibacter sp. H39-3-26]MDF1485849.1 Hsp70 family protein [Ramlibacter sp. H39-3-26]